MKGYAEKYISTEQLEKMDIQLVGNYVSIHDSGLTEKGLLELGMEDESQFSRISYIDSQNSEYIKDDTCIDYNDIDFYEDEWEYFVRNLMNYKAYNHYLVVLLNARWNGASGAKIFDKYEDVFIRDYDVAMYYKSSSPKGKVLELTEYHHDVPTGHNTIIIGLTDAEFEKLAYKDVTELITYANSFVKKEYYVLHYNTKTTEYENNIVFQSYKQALSKYNKELPYHENDRVELMFAPLDERINNEVIASKGAN